MFHQSNEWYIDITIYFWLTFISIIDAIGVANQSDSSRLLRGTENEVANRAIFFGHVVFKLGLRNMDIFVIFFNAQERAKIISPLKNYSD